MWNYGKAESRTPNFNTNYPRSICTAKVIGREVSNELGCQSTDIYYMKPSVLIRDHSFVMFRQEGLSLQTKNKRIYSAIYHIAITALLSDEFVIANAGVDVELRYGHYRRFFTVPVDTTIYQQFTTGSS